MPQVQSLKQNAVNLLPCYFCSSNVLIWCKFLDRSVTAQSVHVCLLSFLITSMQVAVFRCWREALPCSWCLGVDRKVLCFSCRYFSFKPQKHNPFFSPEMLWYGNDQNMVWFQMRYTNFLVLGMKILLSGNTFCVKWWICSCDLCKWLSGGFVAHPILAVKYSFLVTCDILDEFSWLANVLHNCQNFAMLFLRNIEEEVSSTSKFFCYRHSFFQLSFIYTL